MLVLRRNTAKLFTVAAVIAITMSSIFFTSCKKETKTDTVTVTLTGYTVSGQATYPDYTGTAIPAKGAVIYLHTGSSATGALVTTTFADATGKYTFTNILAGSYFITAKYNTDNQNYNKTLNGINFGTNPGYAITVGEAAITQNISLVTIASTSALKITLDTVTNVGYRPVTWEIHSKCQFSFPDHATGSDLPGGFNSFQVDKFVFDAANAAATKISGYVLLSSITTMEPARDGLLTGGCVPKTLLIAVDSVNQIAVPETDTARFTSTSVEKYGDGYIAHGTLTAFYHHGPGMLYPADTNYYKYTGGFKDVAPTSIPSMYWNTRVTKPCDLYFVYQGKFAYAKNTNGTTKNLVFNFEGEFAIHPQTDYYISSAHFSESDIKIKAHVQFQGMLNDTNYAD